MTNSEETKAAPETRRRWWQFSLASLLIMMTVLALCLGFWADSARRQKLAVQWIRERDGQVLYSFEIQRSPNQKLSPPGPDWLREWLGIDYLDNVEVVHVEEPVTDADLAAFAKDLPRLKSLGIGQAASVTDAGLGGLAKGLPRLTYLRIALGASITDAGLVHLARLHDLEFLHIDCPQMTNAGLANLAGLRQLDSVFLQSDHITDDGLVHLRPLKKLYRLQLNCPITDAGMEHLTGHSQLLRLFCCGAPSDAARRKIADALGDNSFAEFIDEPLSNVCNFYAEYYEIKFRNDVPASRETPITANLGGGIRLGQLLDTILRPHDLGWYVGDGEIVVTTAEIDAERHAGINKLRVTLPKLKKVVFCW